MLAVGVMLAAAWTILLPMPLNPPPPASLCDAGQQSKVRQASCVSGDGGEVGHITG